jgi:3-phosphoglycerate kinase
VANAVDTSSSATEAKTVAEMDTTLYAHEKGPSSTADHIVSLDQHGASLATLYRLVDAYAVNHRAAGSVIVVKDGRNNVFGSYINEPVNRREGQYYGGGDS